MFTLVAYDPPAPSGGPAGEIVLEEGSAVWFRLRPRDSRLGPDLTRLCEALVDVARLLSEGVGVGKDEPSSGPGAVVGQGTVFERIVDADDAAEEAMHGVLRELAASLVSPLDRSDVFLLVSAARDCSRAMLDVAQLVEAFGGIEPTEAIVDQLQHVQLAADVAAEAVPRFGRTRVLTESWIELTRLRRRSAARHRESLAVLTDPRAGVRPGAGEEPAAGAAIRPAEAARLAHVESGLQDVMAAFDRLGHAMQLIVVKEG